MSVWAFYPVGKLSKIYSSVAQMTSLFQQGHKNTNVCSRKSTISHKDHINPERMFNLQKFTTKSSQQKLSHNRDFLPAKQRAMKLVTETETESALFAACGSRPLNHRHTHTRTKVRKLQEIISDMRWPLSFMWTGREISQSLQKLVL